MPSLQLVMRLLLAAIVFLAPLGASAQPTQPDSPVGGDSLLNDSASFGALVDAARAEAERLEGARRDEFWQDFAAEAFAFYQHRPTSDGGKDALDMAFRIWGNDGPSEVIDEALAQLDPASDAWDDRLFLRVKYAYERDGRGDEFGSLLTALSSQLSHPQSRSTVLLYLGRQAEQDQDEARGYFEAVIALDADSTAVAESRGFLYEFDHLALGDVAPDFVFTTLDGDARRVSDLRGSFVLLDFWATWCTPCLPELPYLVRAHEEYGEKGLEVVSISFDWDREALDQMIAEHALGWTHARDEQSIDGEAARLYNVRWLPRSFLIDRSGRVVAKDLRGDDIIDALAERL